MAFNKYLYGSKKSDADLSSFYLRALRYQRETIWRFRFILQI
jgi:hypothetical protein